MIVASEILQRTKMPFCPGCGYNASVRSIGKALNNAGYKSNDVVLVTDIGCSGLLDPLFSTHTIHGLHGRSTALGLGISLGLDNPAKKVIVVQGDGGATIGLQHMLEAARRNVNLTHIVLNNLVYGMTGGQISGLSPARFKHLKDLDDPTPPFDICNLTYSAGASFVARVKTPAAYESVLIEAFHTHGYAMVEMPSMCQPYGIKKLSELNTFLGPEILMKNIRDNYKVVDNKTESLFNQKEMLHASFSNNIHNRIGVVIAGSAGAGIQSAAKLLASAGIVSGLSVSMKGEYPITVGTGFSMAEVILSRHKIYYTGLEIPEVLIVLSEDGMKKVKNRIRKHTIVIVDGSVESLELQSNKVIIQNFTGMGGKKGAALAAIAYWIDTFGGLNKQALQQVTGRSKHSYKLMEAIANSGNHHLVN